MWHFFRKWRRGSDRPAAADGSREVLATLLLAAQEDPEFGRRLRFVLRLPSTQRAPLIRTAVDEMRLRGESIDAQRSFSVLSTDEGAATALRLLDD